MNLKEILIRKAKYPVRLICKKEIDFVSLNDELGIEVIDFSIGNLRCVNKNKNNIVEIYYNKENWNINGKWVFK
tara:strand:+ start:228 stop:449 length:222 start_codon:yes stop_codon:yes gene_type:complete